MNNNDYIKSYDLAIGDELMIQMQKDSTLEGFTEGELADILLKMKIFQTGISVMAANRLFTEDINEEEMVKMLDSATDDVISATRLR